MIAAKMDAGITVWSARLALVLLGWFACAIFYGTLTLTKKAAELPVVKAEAGCEHWRANKNAIIAKQAIRSALVDSAPIPSPNAIPQDRCPHTQGK